MWGSQQQIQLQQKFESGKLFNKEEDRIFEIKKDKRIIADSELEEKIRLVEDDDFKTIIKSTPDNKFFYTHEYTTLAERFQETFKRAFKEQIYWKPVVLKITLLLVVMIGIWPYIDNLRITKSIPTYNILLG